MNNASRIASHLASALSGSSGVPATWIFAHWNEVQGGVVKPLTGAIVGGDSIIPRCRMFRGFMHEVGNLPTKVAIFNEIETGEIIVDLPGDADVPMLPEVRWKFSRGVQMAAWSALPLSGLDTLVGDLVPTVNDRVLVLGQSDPEQNGLYVAQDGPWSIDTDTPLCESMPLYIEQGRGAGGWRVASLDPLTIEPDANIDEEDFVAKGTGSKLTHDWDCRLGDQRLVRSMVLRRST